MTSRYSKSNMDSEPEGLETKDVIDRVLCELGRRRRLRAFLELAGKTPWVGDLDKLRCRLESR